MLLTGAMIDRASGWAPDLVVGPAVAAALATGGILGSWGGDPAWLLVGGVAAYIAAQGLWMAAQWRFPERMIPPPADLLALTIPVMIFGLTPAMVAVMMTISAILALCMKSDEILSLFSRQEVVDEVLKEVLGNDMNNERAITFLALSFPVTWLAAAIGILL
ncbi:hypothetical protein [Defluviimonas salinarum]|nr:hypothetical protein [Defluviimonas salinarum]